MQPVKIAHVMASMMAKKPDKTQQQTSQRQRCAALAVGLCLDLTRILLPHTLILRLFAVLLVGSQLLGCTVLTGVRNYMAYNTECDNLVIGWRDHVYSRRAFNSRISQFPASQYPDSFREGFIAGYHDVAKGGKGCPPAIPPRRFWSWKYQTAEGQAKVNEWFTAYPYGARAAEEDGIGNYRDIQISSDLEAMMKTQNQIGRDCLDCGPKTDSTAPLQYPDGETIEPGFPMDQAESSDRRIHSESPSYTSVRPASYVLERLPPVQSGSATIDREPDYEDPP